MKRMFFALCAVSALAFAVTPPALAGPAIDATAYVANDDLSGPVEATVLATTATKAGFRRDGRGWSNDREPIDSGAGLFALVDPGRVPI